MKVCIICPEHGEFWQAPSNHLSGHGCPKCAAKASAIKRCKKFTDFVSEAKAMHGEKYTYPEQTFANVFENVSIICPIHGVFEQSVSNHIRGAGCPKCKADAFVKRKTHTTEDFIAKAQNIHGDRYDYSLVEYKGTHTKVKIVCPEHGVFEQEPKVHITGSGCPICTATKAADSRRGDLQDFIAKARKVHGEKYTYNECRYIDCVTKVAIRCPKHGLFYQRPANHFMGNGCPECGIAKGKEKRITPQDDVIKRLMAIHGDRYDYSKVKYVNSHTKVCIVCPIHGDFMQTPYLHERGSGCPRCRESMGERKVAQWLGKYNISYLRQFRITPQYRIFGPRRLYVDFYLPDHNTVIEYNGEQHYKRCAIWQSEDDFFKQQERDEMLREHCKQHKIKLIEIPYTKIKDIDVILKTNIK